MPASVHNFHLPLPAPTYRRLRDAAERTRQPATTIARHAIETWLREHRRSMVREDIARYAAAAAGGPEDLDPVLEAAALETWQAPEKPGKRSERTR